MDDLYKIILLGNFVASPLLGKGCDDGWVSVSVQYDGWILLHVHRWLINCMKGPGPKLNVRM